MRLTRPALRATGAVAAAALVGAMLTAALAPPAAADSVTAAQGMDTVSHYQGEWTSPPTQLTGGGTVDAPELGNGDVGVAIGGGIDNQTFYLGKNDFWSATSHAIKPLGRVVVKAGGLAGASYDVVQDIAHAEVRGTYTKNGQTLRTTSWVDANRNILVTSFALTGGSTQQITVTLQNGSGGAPAVARTGNDLDADVVADTGGSGDPRARIAARTIGQSQSISGSTLTLTLQPGTSSTLVAGIQSSADSGGYQAAADALVGSLTQGDVDSHQAAHRAWWQSYWSQSYVQIPDKAVEKSWYGSLYLLGCVSRPGKYAPGLWGNWITGNMNWNGDYHTNYNYQAPFYAALTTNHIDQMAAYDKPVLDWMSRGQQLAAQNGFQGVLYPVGISPNATSADMNLHNQKSNAVNLASDMVMRYEQTRDTAYAATVYPFLKQVGLFWQHYLSKDSAGTYTIENDAPQEDNAYPQTNSILSLGLVHLLMQGLVDISTALNQDSGTRATWSDIDAHLAPLPTMTQNGQTVFRETSTGAAFVNDGNDIDIQAVYPGGQVGLDSAPALLQTARNTVGQLTSAWHGGNAPATFYAAAARVGYDPATLLSHLHTEATANSYPNLGIHHSGGGIENLNVTTSGLDEMLLQSFQHDVKVFPDWPAGTDAKFGDLLADGGFLVSSSRSGNAVQYVRAVSQKGGGLTFTNPWPGSAVQVYRNGAGAGTVSGTRITLATTAGETVTLAPPGTSYATVQAELAQPLASSGGSGGTSSSFASGFEPGQAQPSWTDTVDTAGGNATGVTGINGDSPGPQAGVRTGETSRTGGSALMYSGSAAGSSPHAYLKVFDLAGSPLAVGTAKTLGYWIYPQSHATTPWVPAGSAESECVAVDLVFTDGSTLRDSGATDQNGTRAHPAQQCGHLTPDTWNHVTVDLAAHSSGKQIARILIGYDHPGSTGGGYRGYVDDLTIS
ncbi:glycosyl hydrolase family 95 catalytic domain-containing protein [Streptomyces sp. NPDC021020]|uniref:glycosyl hydrolase family 95 catalytic domain-containing protein n=1 Tax=Streptomyces sp. NPDC021020 TaxID=3365109 RepID=UPI0037881E52